MEICAYRQISAACSVCAVKVVDYSDVVCFIKLRLTQPSGSRVVDIDPNRVQSAGTVLYIDFNCDEALILIQASSENPS